jgi:hypothetical protein
MRYLVGFFLVCGAGLAILGTGCGDDLLCTAKGCVDHLQVILEPELDATYHASFTLDGVDGSFTCTWDPIGNRWRLSDVAGPVDLLGCDGSGFLLWHTRPASVEISVTSEDGDWNGFAEAHPSYEIFYANGPRCGPPMCEMADVTVRL